MTSSNVKLEPLNNKTIFTANQNNAQDVKQLTSALNEVLNGQSVIKVSELLNVVYNTLENNPATFDIIFKQAVIYGQIKEVKELFISLQYVIKRAMSRTFKKDGLCSYVTEDFIGVTQLAELSLNIILKIFHSLNHIQTTKISPKTDMICEELNGISVDNFLEVLNCIKDHLLIDIVMLIGANATENLWSSQNTQLLSEKVLICILNLFEIDNLFDLLQTSVNEPKAGKKTLFCHFLEISQNSLSKEQWQHEPITCNVFNWFIRHCKCPNLSNCIDLVMAVALNFIHDHQLTNKLMGIDAIYHLILNVSKEEIRWYNRIEVIFQTLHQQLYTKEPELLTKILKTITLSVGILDKTNMKERHCKLLETFLKNADLENLLQLRLIYITAIKELIVLTGFPCVSRLVLILKVLQNYLEIDSGASDVTRLTCLEVLYIVISVMWLRIPAHVNLLMKMLLRLMVDVQTSNYQKCHSSEAQVNMISEIEKSLNLLIRLSPKAGKTIEALKESKKISLNLNV